MAQAVRRGRLRCSQCHGKGWLQYHLSNFSSEMRSWNNVEVVKRRGEKILCRCRTCGHEYLSDSKPARNAMAYKEKED